MRSHTIPQAPRNFQAVAIHDRRIRKHPIGGAVGLKFARVQDQDALTQIQNEIEVVGRDNLRA